MTAVVDPGHREAGSEDIVPALKRALLAPLPGARAHRLAWPDHLPVRRPLSDDSVYRRAAVLVLLFPRDDGIWIPLVERPRSMSDHPGQIACPGGRLEPEETARAAALRELWEELGVPSTQVEILGELTPVFIPVSGFWVQPFVGWAPEEPLWVPDPREVGRVLFAPADTVARSGPTGRYLGRRDPEERAAPTNPEDRTVPTQPENRAAPTDPKGTPVSIYSADRAASAYPEDRGLPIDKRDVAAAGHGEDSDFPAYEVPGGVVWGATALVLAEFGEIWKSMDGETR